MQRLERLKQLKKVGQVGDDVLASTMASQQFSKFGEIDYTVYYQPMKGINLRKKVNFTRKICQNEGMGALHGEPIITIIEHLDEDEDREPEIALDARLQCQYCNRFFNPESHAKHQNKCSSVFMGLKHKRQPFQSIAQRLSNDEQFQEQIQGLGGVEAALTSGFIKFTAISKLNEQWRMQQATFRAAIQAAKSGNKMEDGTIDDRVLCQYCGRKFRAEAA